jgi:ribonuclease HI
MNRFTRLASFPEEETKIATSLPVLSPLVSHFLAYERRNQKKVLLFCDGASDGNPGPGGWAAILVDDQGVYELGGPFPVATDNQMELWAVNEAVRTLSEPREIILFTDSQYVQDVMSGWLQEWKLSDWTAAGETRELCRRLNAEAAKHRITCQWVPAHPDYERMNERCDTLTRSQIQTVWERLTLDEIVSLRKSFRDHWAI